MKILALDLSTKQTGYAIYENKELKDYGCFTATDSELFDRISKMVQGLAKIMQTNEIDSVVIEEVLMEDAHNNQNTFKALMYLQAFICKFLKKLYNITPEFVVASHWRKMCGIKTGAGIRRDTLKAKDIKFVKDQFGITVNDDIADAICIGFSAVGGEIKKSQIEITDDGFEFA